MQMHAYNYDILRKRVVVVRYTVFKIINMTFEKKKKIINIQWTTDKLMSLGGPKLASRHPKINLSVWKYKAKEGLGVRKRINTTVK